MKFVKTLMAAALLTTALSTASMAAVVADAAADVVLRGDNNMHALTIPWRSIRRCEGNKRCDSNTCTKNKENFLCKNCGYIPLSDHFAGFMR